MPSRHSAFYLNGRTTTATFLAVRNTDILRNFGMVASRNAVKRLGHWSVQLRPRFQNRLDADRSLQPLEVCVLDVLLNFLADFNQRSFLYSTASGRLRIRPNQFGDFGRFIEDQITHKTGQF